MKVLAFELSSARGSVAVLRDGDQLFAREFANDRRNSGAFFQAISDARENLNVLDRIAVGIGPGSYAGTRIAISAAIGLQLATGATLVGLPSICAFDVCELTYGVIGDARRNLFWIALVEDAVAVQMPTLMSEVQLRAQIEETLLPIFSAERLPDFPRVPLAFPSAARLASIASADHPNAMLPPLQPLYLREPHITVSKQPVWKSGK